MKKIFVLLFILPHLLYSNLAEVYNYTTDDYEGHSINYDAIEDTSGIMYFANAYSVLEFDGIQWRSIPLHDVSPSSFAKGPDGTVYVGAFSDFGYLVRDAKGKGSFSSLLLKIKIPDHNVGIINHTIYFKQKVYYCSSAAIYVYDGKNVEVIFPEKDAKGLPSKFGFMGLVGDELLVYNDYRGLGKVMEGKFHPLSFSKSADDSWLITAFGLSENKYLIVTKDHLSIFDHGNYNPISFKKDGVPVNITITHAIDLGGDKLAIGTELFGVLICDKNGNILKTYDKQSGLKSNYVNRLFRDSKGNLWAMLNNGISILKISSSYQYLNEIQGVEGMGYSSLLVNDTLYLGTSQGLFYTSGWTRSKELNFTKVTSVGLVINDIRYFNGRIICSDQANVYELNNLKATIISPEEWHGGWVFKKVPKNDSLMICGTYDDFRVYAFRKGHWVFRNIIAGFHQSCRMFEFDEQGVLWMVQGIAGLFKIEFSTDFSKTISVVNFAAKLKLDPGYFNDIVKVNQQIKVSSDGGMYYVSTKGELLKDPQFSQITEHFNRIRAVEGSNILYILLNERPAFLELQNGKYVLSALNTSSVKDKLVGSAEYISKIAEGEYLVATQQGFAYFKANEHSKDQLPKCLIREVKLINGEKDSTLLYGSIVSLENDYSNNNLSFHFSLPVFGVSSNLKFRTELSSHNSNLVWKDESKNSFKEYTNLPEGEYTLKVWAIVNGKESPVQLMTFTIFPPWYRSAIAYTLYILFFVILVYVFNKQIRIRFKRQREKLEQEKLLELQSKESIHKNELLEIELQRKNDEMAFLALNFTQKKQFLGFLRGQLSNISKNITDEKSNGEIKSLIRSIGMEDEEEENWDKFQMHFDKTNDNFFHKLKQLDPKVNESTMLMCSYIKMGKSNKEIADLLNISISGVEKRKYRLKDKLGLSETTSITTFICEL